MFLVVPAIAGTRVLRRAGTRRHWRRIGWPGEPGRQLVAIGEMDTYIWS
jgi:hypothetical protein